MGTGHRQSELGNNLPLSMVPMCCFNWNPINEWRDQSPKYLTESGKAKCSHVNIVGSAKLAHPGRINNRSYNKSLGWVQI